MFQLLTLRGQVRKHLGGALSFDVRRELENHLLQLAIFILHGAFGGLALVLLLGALSAPAGALGFKGVVALFPIVIFIIVFVRCALGLFFILVVIFIAIVIVRGSRLLGRLFLDVIFLAVLEFNLEFDQFFDVGYHIFLRAVAFQCECAHSPAPLV